MAVKVVFRKPEMDFLLHEHAGPVGRYMYAKGVKVQTKAKLQVGKRTGKLAASIKVKHGRSPIGQTVLVGSDVSYAYMHHEGTRPHVITPVRAKQLVFSVKGKVVRTNRVNHPGTKPNRYLADNLRFIL